MPTYRGRRVQAPARGIQGRRADQDALPVAKKFSCASCQITYYVAERDPVECPLCQAQRQLERLRTELDTTLGKLRVTTENVRKLRAEVDVVEAIRQAVDLLDDNDMLFFKTTLYQWKINRSVALKTTGTLLPGQTIPTTIGFIVMPRTGDPVAHTCTSIGGRAIAEYFSEAMNTSGPAQALLLLVRAFAQHLPGGNA